MNGELLLSIFSFIAQQGRIIDSTFCYGYDYSKEDKQFHINPTTSKIIKGIFNLSLEGYGIYKIDKILTNEGIPTAKGNDVWNGGTITHILRNERYKGDLLIGKYFSIDPVTKKAKRNKGGRDQYYIRKHHETIIDEDTLNKVQNIMKERVKPGSNKTDKDFNNKYSFSGKLVSG